MANTKVESVTMDKMKPEATRSMTRAEMKELTWASRCASSIVCECPHCNSGQAIEQLLEETRWIPVAERLPEENEEVLVRDEEKNIYVAGFFSATFHFRTKEDTWFEVCVRAEEASRAGYNWMPLPKAPEE